MHRRRFLGSIASTGAAIALIPDAMAAEDVPAQAPTLISRLGSSRATAYGEANKIVTLDGKTHVAWLDSPPEGFRVRISTLDHAAGEWSPTYTLGEAYDNHGGPALTVDSQGFLHVAYYPHHHPMRYRRSKRPNDASEWNEVVPIGQRLTYPTLVCGPDDTLYLTCRASSDGPWSVQLFVKPPGGDWQGPTTLLRSRQPGYSHYQEALAWGPDHRTLHLSCRISEPDGDKMPGQHQAVGYMVSRDFGKTWHTSNGRRIKLPATIETIDVIDSLGPNDRPATVLGRQQNIVCGNLAVDTDDRPHLLYSNLLPLPGRTFLSTPAGDGRWQSRSLHDLIGGAWSDWTLTTPGGLALGAAGRTSALLTRQRPEADPAHRLWGHPTTEVIHLASTNSARTFRPLPVSPVNPKLANWMPNLERPTGHNAVTVPSLLYTSGPRGRDNKALVANAVYWTRLD